MQGYPRAERIHELYDLMESLADEHDADSGSLRKVDDRTARVELQFTIPPTKPDLPFECSECGARYYGRNAADGCCGFQSSGIETRVV